MTPNGRFTASVLFPPARALEEVAAAADIVARLERENRRLHFEVDADGRLVEVQLQDLEGRVIRTVSGAEALELMSRRRSP
jgi:hypothetical protein